MLNTGITILNVAKHKGKCVLMKRARNTYPSNNYKETACSTLRYFLLIFRIFMLSTFPQRLFKLTVCSSFIEN